MSYLIRIILSLGLVLPATLAGSSGAAVSEAIGGVVEPVVAERVAFEGVAPGEQADEPVSGVVVVPFITEAQCKIWKIVNRPLYNKYCR